MKMSLCYDMWSGYCEALHGPIEYQQQHAELYAEFETLLHPI